MYIVYLFLYIKQIQLTLTRFLSFLVIFLLQLVLMRKRRKISRTSTSERKHFVKPLFAIVMLIAFFFVAKNVVTRVASMAPAQEVVETVETMAETIIPHSQEEQKPTLQDVVNKTLENTTGSYGIYIKNLKTTEEFAINAEESYDTASLYKLWIMATAYEQISQGKLEETETMKQKVEELNKKFGIASESAELKEGEIEITVESALKQMISISHNYAALILSEKVRLSNVRTFLEEQGLENSKLGTENSLPQSTPRDIGLFFEKLYNGELVSAEYSVQMLDVLKQQRLVNKLPAQLPEDVEIAHKNR